MNSAAATQEVATSEATLNAAWPELTVHIFYEDLAAGLRAKQTLDLLESQLPVSGGMRVQFWRFDLLNEPALREEVANAAMGADLVLLSAHGQHGLPEDVSVWIREWLGRRTDEPPALVVLLDASSEGMPKVNESLAWLRRAAEPAGVEVFPRFCESPPGPNEMTIEEIHHRAETTTTLLSEMLAYHPTQSYRDWGINE